jgi:RimJ/RimL family protein N-acetyltransferase
MSSELLELRPVQADDLQVFYQHQLDPLACQMAGFPSREREAFMAHWAKILRDDNNHNFTIVYGGQVAGNIASFLQAGEREVCYWIGQEFWGQGIATRALAAFLQIELERPLSAVVYQPNLASRRVLEKCGFQLVAEADDEYHFKIFG